MMPWVLLPRTALLANPATSVVCCHDNFERAAVPGCDLVQSAQTYHEAEALCDSFRDETGNAWRLCTEPELWAGKLLSPGVAPGVTELQDTDGNACGTFDVSTFRVCEHTHTCGQTSVWV